MNLPAAAGDVDLGGADAQRVEGGQDSAQVVRALFRRDSVYTLLWVLQLLGAALLTPLITRVISTAEFGVVASSNAVMQVLFVLAGVGLQTAIQRAYAAPGGPEDAPRVLTLSIVLAAALTGVALATVPVWGPALGFDSQLRALETAVLWAGTSAVTGACLGLLRSRDALAGFSAVSLVQSVVAEATSLLLLLLVHRTAEMFVLGQLLAQAAALALGLALARPRRLRRHDRALVTASLAYGLPLVPAVLGTFVLGAADRLILQSLLGSDAVARYQVCYNIASAPMLLLSVLHSSWLPRLFSLAPGAERAVVLDASRDALYRLLAPSLVGLSLGVPIVLRVWAPARYRTDELLVMTAVIIVSAVPFAAGLAASRALLIEGRSGVIAVHTALAAAANVALNLVLVPRAGLLGSALATFASYALLHLLLLRAQRSGGRSTTAGGLSRAAGVALLTVPAALLVALVPTGAGFLVARGALASGCLLLLVVVVRRTGAQRGPAEVAA